MNGELQEWFFVKLESIYKKKPVYVLLIEQFLNMYILK